MNQSPTPFQISTGFRRHNGGTQMHFFLKPYVNTGFLMGRIDFAFANVGNKISIASAVLEYLPEPIVYQNIIVKNQWAVIWEFSTNLSRSPRINVSQFMMSVLDGGRAGFHLGVGNVFYKPLDNRAIGLTIVCADPFDVDVHFSMEGYDRPISTVVSSTTADVETADYTPKAVPEPECKCPSLLFGHLTNCPMYRR